jgi:hypothetical protein
MRLESKEDWLGAIWESQPDEISKPWSVLVMDAFHGHFSARIRNMLRNKNINLVTIHNGITGQLQPLHVSVKTIQASCL